MQAIEVSWRCEDCGKTGEGTGADHPTVCRGKPTKDQAAWAIEELRRLAQQCRWMARYLRRSALQPSYGSADRYEASSASWEQAGNWAEQRAAELDGPLPKPQ